MTKILTAEQIRAVVPDIDLMSEIEAGFVAYSQGKAEVPPVGELLLQDPPPGSPLLLEALRIRETASFSYPSETGQELGAAAPEEP